VSEWLLRVGGELFSIDHGTSGPILELTAMTTDQQTEIKTADQLKSKLSSVLSQAQLSEGEKAEVLHGMLAKARGETGGPTARGAGTPGAKTEPPPA
jgi:hypothetical protein